MALLRRLLATSTVALVLVNLLARPGDAQQREPFIETDPATIALGGETTVRGRGFRAGADLELRLDTPSSEPLVTLVVEADGTFEHELTLDATAPGSHQLIACTVTRSPCAERAVTEIVVLDRSLATPTTSTTSLPPPVVPPLPPGPGDVVAATTTTTTSTTLPPGPDDRVAATTLPPSTTIEPTGADDLAVSTTIGLDPPFDPTIDDFAIPTTTERPSFVAPGPIGHASLAITAVELTQGTQNLDNDMAMVAGRRTVARVYVETDGDDALVRGRAGLFRNGTLVASLDAQNQPVHATANGGDRLDIDSTLLFTLPQSWTTSGPATLSFFVYEVSAQHTLDNDIDPADNFFDVVTHFFTATPLSLVLVPVHLHDDYDPAKPELTWNPADHFADTVEIVNGVRRYLPIADLDAVIWPTEVIPAGHAQGNEFDLDEQTAAESGNASAPHQQIAVMRDNSTYYTGSRWYGTLPPSGLQYSMWSTSTGAPIGWGGLASNGVSIGLMSTETRAASPWRLRGSYLIGHELGHNYGLGHVDCAGTEAAGGAIDPDFPTPAPNCSMAPVDPDGWYGFDVYGPAIPSAGAYEVISNDPNESDPHQGWPLMSYARPEWLDPYAYCSLQAAFLVPCLAYGAAFAGAPGANQSETIGSNSTETVDGAGHDEEIDVYGVSWSAVADAAGGTGALTLVMERADGRAAMVDDGHDHDHDDTVVVVEVLDADGTVVGTETVDPGHGLLPHEVLELGATGALGIGGHVAVTGEPVAIRLVVAGEQVDRVDASASAPTIELGPLESGDLLADAAVVAWTATDADGDPLSFDLRFSPDGGSRWVAVATGLTTTTHEIDTAALPATTDGVLQVRTHDGFHTATAELTGLTVADGPPQAPLILAPADGARLRPHEPFTIEAQATDATDRIVRRFGAASDLAGPLGATEDGTLDVGGLAEGRHAVTVTAVDSAGATSMRTITVVVEGEPLVGDPAATELLAARADGTLDLSARHDGGGTSDSSVTIALVAAAVGAAALASAVPAVRRARRTGP